MAACIAAFNNDMQLDAYLDIIYNVMTRKMTPEKILQNTHPVLCVVHTMSVKLKVAEKRSNVQKINLTYFTTLQHSASPQSALLLYENICVVLCSPYETTSMTKAHHLL